MHYWTRKTLIEQYASAYEVLLDVAIPPSRWVYDERAEALAREHARGVLQGIAAVYAGIEGIDPQVAGDELRDLINEEATR